MILVGLSDGSLEGIWKTLSESYRLKWCDSAILSMLNVQRLCLSLRDEKIISKRRAETYNGWKTTRLQGGQKVTSYK